MDSFLHADKEVTRECPRRSPLITQGLTSPTRSIHAMQLESLSSQPDMGMRTVDLFEADSSGSDEGKARGKTTIDGAGLRPSVEKKRRTASSNELYSINRVSRFSDPDSDLGGYQRISTGEEGLVNVDTASSSFHGSVEELLQGNTDAPPFRTARIASEFTPRSSTYPERPVPRHMSVPATKVDQTLGAYAIAHEITLNSLMRDEKVLDETLQAYALAPMPTDGRPSALSPAIDPRIDPRSPLFQVFSSPATTTTKQSAKSVHLAPPPPIDTNAAKHSLPENLIRTPYPFTTESLKQRELQSAGPSKTASSTESYLTVSIRKSNANSRTRVTSLTIPATNDFTAVRLNSVGANERHFKALDFDDATFFRELQKSYKHLSGSMRFLSARSLTRIVVVGGSTNTAAQGWRNPRVASMGLSDTFSEEQILRHYRDPSLGYGRYAFVHWVHRLASHGVPRQEEGADEDERNFGPTEKELPGRVEYVVTWSASRISLAFLLVVLASIAAALLCILLPNGGVQSAGSRVGAGVLMGIGALLLGLSGVGGWLGLSWLLM